MKPKKERERQVSVHSCIAATSGPKPDIKVKKHFEIAWKEKKRNYGTTASKPVENLPCISEEREEETVVQKSRLKTRQSVDKKKWTQSSRIQAQSSRGQKPAVPTKFFKKVGEKQQKKQINVMVPTVSADTASSSSNITEQKMTNTPVTSSSELQFDPSTIINKENMQPHSDRMFNFSIPGQSEISMLYKDKPSCPSLSLPPCEKNIDSEFSWNPSLMCKLLNKPYEQMFYQDASTMISKGEPSFGTNAFNNYNIPDRENPTRDVPTFLISDDAPVCPSNSVCEKSNKKLLEERSTQVREIQLELLRWREKLKEQQKEGENANKPLNINTLPLQSCERVKKILQKTPMSFEPLEEVEEEIRNSGSDSSSEGQRYPSTNSAPPPSPASQQQ